MRAPRSSWSVLLAAGALLLAGCGEEAAGVASSPTTTTAGPLPRPPASAAPQPERRSSARLRAPAVARGFRRPVGVAVEPAGRRRTLVIEQPGTARWLTGRRVARGRAFLDVRRITMNAGERGLLSVAFVPGYPRDPRVVVHHSTKQGQGDTRVFVAPVRAGRVDVAAGRELLRERQPYENHKGGPLAFDRRGRLLLGLGDGGSAFDPRQHGQSARTRLAKILRTDGPLTDAAPRWDTVAYGARNPWRFSIDAPTGDLWIADVGQDIVEEIDRLGPEQLDAPQPANLGWSVFEGTVPLSGGRRRLDGRGPLVWPVASYRHARGRCSVTGGVVARGPGAPRALRERYVFGDFCTGEVWSIPSKGPVTALRRERPIVRGLTSIAADARGRLLATTITGEVHALRAR